MNDVVFTLAQRTAVILEFLSQEQPEEVQTITSPNYFKKLGVPGGSIGDYPDSTDDLGEICIEINNTINYYEKIYLLLLIHDCLLKFNDQPAFNDHLKQVYESIGIDTGLIDKFMVFFAHDNLFAISSNEFLILSPQNSVDNEMLEGRWIEDNVPRGREVAGNFTVSQIDNHLLVMFIEPIRTYVVRCIDNSGKIFDQDPGKYCNFRMLKPGNELSIQGVPVLTFSDLKSRFLQLNEKRELSLAIDRIQYTNKKGIREIHAFSSRELTGQLIGIVGREGVGKSTLLKLLAGKFEPSTGCITINGYDLWKNKYLLKGVIGFVPEEDLLFEDMTVGDNMLLTARLYYSTLGKKEIEAKVNALLSRIDLLEIKHVVVGKPDNKTIQPGHRRLINIALELLREPQILLVDNALSGLGMSDACRVIKVLHDYSFSGNLVITSISQVDSETFMLFDKIWILDEGGYPVYNGPVKAAPGYLFKKLKLVYPNNEVIDPARLLDWVNYRLPDKDAHVWKRVVEPESWHDEYLREQILQESGLITRTRLPARILKIPNLEVQLLIFSIRNIKCKFSRFNEIIKALLIGPAIALLFGLLLRTGEGGDYSLFSNRNIPLYQFISVVIALFLGLISSADEIIRERNILEKEEYQEFSRFSYLNSKILYLFPVIAFQILLYVLTGNFILGIKGMNFIYWIVLFSSACFGILLGLVLSASVTNRHFLYKTVLPFIIALQLLLGGGIISYERLNLGSSKYTPVLGDLMVSRWGYEALAVEQFKDNAFEKLVYENDKNLDQAAFYSFHGVPQLESSYSIAINSEHPDTVKNSLALLEHEIRRTADVADVFPFEYVNLIPDMVNKEDLAQEVSGYITYLSLYFYDQYDTLVNHKTTLLERLSDSLGAENFEQLRLKHHNLALEQTVTNSTSEQPYRVVDNEIVRTSGMIYDVPDSKWGRACLFSPVKIFQIQQAETLWFNIAVIWFFISICYVWVLFDISGTFIRLIESRKREQ